MRPSPLVADEVAGSSGGRWRLTDRALEALLSSLDPDRERAAQKYEELHHKLVVFFCGRGVPVAEDQADETLDRLSRRVATGEPIRHVSGFAYGVARLVLREFHRRDRRQRGALERASRNAPAAVGLDSDAGIECLRRCISRLEPDARELILAYYESDGREGQIERRDLARRLGISPIALRLRAHRIRRALEVCARRCLEGASWDGGGGSHGGSGGR